MAIYHFSLDSVSRGRGRSSLGASAYRSGEKLHSEYDGLTHDYTKKSGILHTAILLPEFAPAEYSDRQTLWNAVEKSEKRCDARTAREFEIALPRELSTDEQIKLVNDYVNAQLISRGLCVDVAIHSGHQHSKKESGIDDVSDLAIHKSNPHAHILFNTRPIDEAGDFSRKKDRGLDDRKNLFKWREEWANAQNKEFERKGLDVRVSHESHEKRGLEAEPTLHMGHKNTALERRGVRTERGNQNRAITERNKAREARKGRIKANHIQIQKERGEMSEKERYTNLQNQEREAFKIPDREKREQELLRIKNERVKLRREIQQERKQERVRTKERELEK
jgi:hypothetical protein